MATASGHGHVKKRQEEQEEEEGSYLDTLVLGGGRD